MMSHNPVLFKRFLQHPTQVGALCASSPALCRTIVSRIGVERAELIIELGPGTGVITREIVKQMPKRAKLIAIELDKALCEHLEKAFPGVVVCNDSAAQIGSILKDRSLPKANAVISGLPWAIFPAELQREILVAVSEHLLPGGWFATFAYIQGLMLPAGLRFRRLLGEVFGKVETSPVVWRNLPPAFVYRCRK